MENPEFNMIVLKQKKDKVIQTVGLACEYCNLTMPTINFDGCSLEGRTEKAHYHVDGNK